MDTFTRIDTLIEMNSRDGVDEAKSLLSRFKGKSEALSNAIDEFLLDFITLVFLIESGEEGFQTSIRKLARTRLSKIKLLVGS
ncbi:hypothetical protein OHD62_19405 [Mesorhizobium sp. YC-39]|uniref:hypothetical protein n=1 Tax=unclassified Mesorhizobium TaxID=325217 RepID=UPI0021E73BC9|nr:MULTISPECIES: hypothetical protein [unclassified Mesorhizobium]MCV3210012.1 hypothetical protein [Mesorhizobium sp. YC-2]MCV3230542.1 hypothetical protein [Mesorhizobium sp. YC-39]